MTELRKRVVRRTAGVCNTVRRCLVVALEPGDVLAIREAGRRHWVRAPLSRVFCAVSRWNADAVAAEKRAKRKASGGKA